MATPITEAANPITRNIDVATPTEMLGLLQKCDSEIFQGWQDYQGLYHPATSHTIEQISQEVKSILQTPDTGLVIFSGCGTSGRLAFVTARTFNRRQEKDGKPPCFKYLIAGHDKALFTSQEAPEDDPAIGIHMLREACVGKTKVLYIGITCGLSAPYVAGQLHYCMQNPDYITPVLVGFNPVSLARNIEIENWNRTFSNVAYQLQEVAKTGKGFILNPVIGPEPITGSSRMKSGSTTKILLEAILVAAYDSLANPSHAWDTHAHLETYRMTCDHVYSQSEAVAGLIQLAGNSLNAGGSVHYLGWDGIGVMALIDASECPPTYGATLDDIRGFVEEGYSLLSNNAGDIGHLGKHFKISLQTFESDILPDLTESDLVILCHSGGAVHLAPKLWKSKCKKGIITFDADFKSNVYDQFDKSVTLTLPADDIKSSVGDGIWDQWQQLYQEIATKWVCNAVTTGAHVLKGKVFQNIMVDLKVSNNKLFHRAVGIIQRFSSLCEEAATAVLLKSVYQTDVPTQTQLSLSTSSHIERATAMEKGVPCALLTAITKCSIAEALLLIDKQPVIRTAISDSMKNFKSS
ncbi:glucokinase regulatory protein-like [Mizuhopecten yessoensis]|uniref:Glucokinase regulatory protein n=1 Tax=Mizuhopecten yessoensis TaxID=6573 RepID=A0A210QGI7_MIZYE|nr:glucokinase regulatory protein-like [Mizuhopecten yessoensis]XP_021358644.1 glucokinase regulatory protein-like [Mizuhopecten yessoensis]XP_021358645.1 glucokinase regulatory protein-like [Mizuhopecten yessoensis]XP_021358646.1 glucokinase regulatory protein-like [Mizuhopecten yessoensis]XP_021358647.1 glucokinase regulatory protein-like [Mizuhopecten yessoensis]XP_021358648.1 glucokinase regulatory protein-like [Mizuhopecten yessoensis]OWF47883.1 Glucokinase regulatory protein [Mizuhopect